MMLASVSMSDNDRRLLIAAFIILIILFILVGLIGMLIRKIMQVQGRKLDELVSHAVHFRILEDEKHFKRYAYIKSRRLFYKEALPPCLILFASLLFYLIYAGVTGEWVHDYWKDYGTIFFLWDFGNEESYVTFWGMRLLASWPPLSNTPHFVAENYASYILCSLWLVGGTYFLVVGQGYLSRTFMIGQRASTVYSKSLEGFNYYDSIYPANGVANPYTGVDLNTGRRIDPNQQNNNYPR